MILKKYKHTFNLLLLYFFYFPFSIAQNYNNQTFFATNDENYLFNPLNHYGFHANKPHSDGINQNDHVKIFIPNETNFLRIDHLFYLIFGVFVVFGILLFVYLKFYRKSKSSERFSINSTEESFEPENPILTLENFIEGSILDKTEEKLIKQLEKFERSNRFTSKNISLSQLASSFQTNTKYMSYIIKKYRNANFNQYITDLRIHYILKKFEEDSAYLDYKISYLAEECGFSSHSRFTEAFKRVTEIPPSEFIIHKKLNLNSLDIV